MASGRQTSIIPLPELMMGQVSDEFIRHQSPRLNIKTVLRPSYLYYGNLNTGKMVFLWGCQRGSVPYCGSNGNSTGVPLSKICFQ